MSYHIHLILLLAGLFLGFSIGIGFKPWYKQPDNLIIQVCSAIIGLTLIAIGFKQLDIF